MNNNYLHEQYENINKKFLNKLNNYDKELYNYIIKCSKNSFNKKKFLFSLINKNDDEKVKIYFTENNTIIKCKKNYYVMDFKIDNNEKKILSKYGKWINEL
jgi:hypothetical protein